MPSIGFGEILVLLVFALVVFGPKRLPELGRSVGRGMREFRRASSEIRAELDLEDDEEPPVVPSPAQRRRERASGGDTAPDGERPDA
ncbi:MAG TPA: twin-arginine translocase TatA/TatE family subunit [Actinomycetota bacterium]|nr:twin-arginine translocase TatA/TatE family subunit [Actinomycetota bacterium]